MTTQLQMDRGTQLELVEAPSGGKQRIPLAKAEALAAEVVDLLRPYCARIEIAGSIRRRKAEVGDLEVVCVPRVDTEVLRLNLFGEPEEHTVNELDNQCDQLLSDGVFGQRLDKNGRGALGEKYKRLTFRGVGLDLFSVVPPAQWGVSFTIRTGSSAFSRKFVTSRLLGGWLPVGYRVRDGALWKGDAPVTVPEEEDWFALCGLPWLEPERRTDTVEPRMSTKRNGMEWRDEVAK